jgi:hypothetical protein
MIAMTIFIDQSPLARLCAARRMNSAGFDRAENVPAASPGDSNQIACQPAITADAPYRNGFLMEIFARQPRRWHA